MDPTERAYRVAIGPVTERKLEPGAPEWHAFNGSFVNREMRQMDIAQALYEGHPITTQHANHWRHSRNYQAGQHIGMDFDTEDQRSTLKTLQQDPFIARYGAILYTTMSHTPAAPRARAIFLLDQPIMQARNYALASAALLWVFGSADRQCKDAARFFYGGRPGACEMEWLANELPLELVKDLIRRYQQTGQHARRQVNARYQGQTPDETELMDALKAIDPWTIDYDEWVAVLMAIHSAYPNETGLSIAESWADGKAGEVEHKWRGFRPDGNPQGKVGVGTLFAVAKQHGWKAA